jgi:hemoglobin/transferrin/lactoferrin receptor protein
MNKTKQLMFSFIASSLLVSCVNAEQISNTKKIDEVTVTAQRTEQSLSTVSKSVSVIENETIQRRQSVNLPQLMNEEVGISFAPDGMQSGQVVIRGFSTQNFRAPLFVNGDRFRGRNTLEYMLLDPNQVERVEIIRGPASSLYGTDSFGGVINVITKRATGDVTAPFHMTDSYYNVEYQSVNDGLAHRLQLGGVGNGFDVLLGLNYRDANNYESGDGIIPNSDYRSKGYDARIGYTIAPNHRVEFISKYTTVTRGRAGGQFAAPGAGNDKGELQRVQREEPMKEQYNSFRYEGEIPSLGLDSFEASLYRRELNTHVSVIPNLNNPSVYVDSYVNGPTVYGGKFIGVHGKHKKALTSTYGMDWYFEDRDSSEQSTKGAPRVKSSPQSEQLNIGAFMLHEYTFDNDAILSGSLRYDYVKTSLDTGYITDSTTKELFNKAGDTTNYKATGGLGLIYPLWDNIDLKANVNTSFRAPSTAEVSAVGTGVYSDFRVPNPDIKPEEGITYEVGARYTNDNLISNLTFFTSDYDNLITTENITYKGLAAKQIQNIGEARIWGIEFDLDYELPYDLSFKTNVSYLKGKDKTIDEPLEQIMPLNGFLSLKYEPESLRNYYVELTAQWAKKRTKVDKTSERERSGYFVPNIYAGFDMGKVNAFDNVSFNFGIENIFDKAYSMPTVPENIAYDTSKTNPLLQPGRNFKIAMKIDF